MDRRDFIKKSALTAVGGLLMATPIGNIFAKEQNEKPENEPIKTNKIMKVLLINGSPHKQGNTFTALSEVAKTLEKQGIEAEIVHIGVKPIRGCIACGQCHMNGLGKCIFDDDVCNSIVDKLGDADGLIIGSPVYYGQPNGSVLSLMQRCWRQGKEQACGCRMRLSSWRSYRSLSDVEHAIPDDEYACRHFAVLEHRLWHVAWPSFSGY